MKPGTFWTCSLSARDQLDYLTAMIRPTTIVRSFVRPSLRSSCVAAAASSTSKLAVAVPHRNFSRSSRALYANPSPAADVASHSENPILPSLHTFTEEEDLLRETVKRFSQEVVEPKVRDMDENEKMDPEIIKGLFENGVSGLVTLLEGRVRLTRVTRFTCLV